MAFDNNVVVKVTANTTLKMMTVGINMDPDLKEQVSGLLGTRISNVFSIF